MSYEARAWTPERRCDGRPSHDNPSGRTVTMAPGSTTALGSAAIRPAEPGRHEQVVSDAAIQARSPPWRNRRRRGSEALFETGRDSSGSRGAVSFSPMMQAVHMGSTPRTRNVSSDPRPEARRRRGAPEASSDVVRRRFSMQRRRDTAPEIALRRELHRRGFRYRVDVAPTGGRRRADIVFTRLQVAVFVDGCFWHSCPAHASRPTANAEWWADKLERNTRRDREVDAALGEAGWHVVRVWEHEPATVAADRVQAIVVTVRGGVRRD